MNTRISSSFLPKPSFWETTSPLRYKTLKRLARPLRICFILANLKIATTNAATNIKAGNYLFNIFVTYLQNFLIAGEISVSSTVISTPVTVSIRNAILVTITIKTKIRIRARTPSLLSSPFTGAPKLPREGSTEGYL